MIISLGSNVVYSKPVKQEDGTLKVLGGGLGVVNSENHYFPVNETILALFNQSSALVRRAKNNTLKGENKHPIKRHDETKEDFVKRFLDIDSDRVAFLIRNVTVDQTPVSMPGQPFKVHRVWLHIEPMGVYGDALMSDLMSNSNTAFSIRALSKRGNANGRVTRSLFHIVTWDWVNEPGINFANKHHTQENRVDLDAQDLLNMVDADDLSTESASIVSHLKSCTGYQCTLFTNW